MSATRKKLLHKLKSKYRLVIMNDQTFEEKFSLRLTPMNLFIAISSFIVVFVLLILSLFFVTPLREYVPGYTGYNNPETKRQATHLTMKIDSLEQVIRQQNAYQNNLNDIMHGREPSNDPDTTANDSLSSINLPASSDSEVDKAHKGIPTAPLSVQQGKEAETGMSRYTFLSPLKGIVTEKFNYQEEHYAIDVVAPANEPVKATLDGTVIFASWTPETGHVIGIQHNNNLISIYKHNAVLLKKVGTFVNSGDAIAVVGNSGELTSGPHLHFELWHNGNPVNPEKYMVF